MPVSSLGTALLPPPSMWPEVNLGLGLGSQDMLQESGSKESDLAKRPYAINQETKHQAAARTKISKSLPTGCAGNYT